MNRPAGKEDDGPDLLDALQDIKNELRKEFDEKLNALRDELMKKIQELEKKDKDQDEEISLVNKLFDKHEKTLEDLQDQINQLKS